MAHALFTSLEHVPTDALLANLKDLVGRSNQLTAVVLAHLAEVDAREVYREHACSSLYAYCIYELRMSEDEAQRRIAAARAARRFPVLFEMVEAGAIHLTGLALLAPHLTDDNHEQLLAQARFRSKREIQKLIAEVCPSPDVPALVQPLGPVSSAAFFGPATWSALTTALAGPVRDIPPGNGRGQAPTPPELPASSAPAELPAPASATTPLRYKVQFTAEQRYVDLLEEARDLLAHDIVNRDIAAVHLRAMEALVAQLKKRRCAATERPRKPAAGLAADSPAPDKVTVDDATSAADSPAPDKVAAHAHAPAGKSDRTLPAEVVRGVWARDGSRCTFVDARGVRCRETSGLEIHHIDPHARGGPPTVENLTLHCRAHNALAAEMDYGRTFMRQRLGGARSARSDEPTAR